MNIPNDWNEMRLCDVLDTLENGSRPKGGINDLDEDIPSLGGEHLNSIGGFNFISIKYISIDFYESLKRGKINNGDVLVVKDGATTGKTSFVNEDFPFEKSAVNEHVFILRGKKDLIHQKYLFYHLFSPTGQRQIAANFHGAAVGGINTQFIKNYNLVLPPFETQKKIVSLLDKIEKLKEYRKQSHKLTIDYLDSAFLKLFGDPVKNEKNWKLAKLKDICKLITVGIVVKPASYYVSDGVPALRGLNVRKNRIIMDDLVYISEENNNTILSKSKIKYRDVLIVRSGYPGTACIVPKELDGANCIDLIILRPDDDMVKSEYLCSFINNDKIKNLILSTQTGSAQKHFNIGAVKKLDILVPSIESQIIYSSVVKNINKLEKTQNQSKEKIDDFFQVILKKSMSGEIRC